jgi:hypothetical protein
MWCEIDTNVSIIKLIILKVLGKINSKFYEMLYEINLKINKNYRFILT